MYGIRVPFGSHTIKDQSRLNARNFSLAEESSDRIVCTCPTSYANLKECKEILTNDLELKNETVSILKTFNREFDTSIGIEHISDVFLSLLEDIKAKAVLTGKGLKAVTHHGCHYSKMFHADVKHGTYERPEVLDEIAKGLGFEVVEYEERSLCCGMGFHHMMLMDEYPEKVLERKFSSILEASPDLIITQCPGCIFNLDHYQEILSKN